VIKTAPQLFAVGREVFVVEPDHFVFFRGGELFHPTFNCQLKSTFIRSFFHKAMQTPWDKYRGTRFVFIFRSTLQKSGFLSH